MDREVDQREHTALGGCSGSRPAAVLCAAKLVPERICRGTVSALTELGYWATGLLETGYWATGLLGYWATGHWAATRLLGSLRRKKGPLDLGCRGSCGGWRAAGRE